jgi:hypothetical protein
VKGIQRSVIKELLALYANEFKILFPSLLWTATEMCDIWERLFWRILRYMFDFI